jgi:hypothetical protein
MKLDRNTSGRGKYALIKLRNLAALPEKERDEMATMIDLMKERGIIDLGATPDTDFFVMRLKDKYAAAGLSAYAVAAFRDDPEYCREVFALAKAAMDYKEPRQPD